MSKPEQQRSLSRFRLFVCLVGATKLCIKGVPSFQPNLAYAHKMFDYLNNNMAVGEYNLPTRSARKSLKTDENLRTMCVMTAVAKVFMFKQTAVEFDAGRLGDDCLPQPFRWTMLYDVIRQLTPSPELIYIAWSQSLDYNIGTAAHSFAAMTAICESFGIRVGQWLKKPPATEPSEHAHSQMSPSLSANNQRPVRDERMDKETYEKAMAQWERQCNLADNYNRFCEYDDALTSEGMTREERIDMFTGMARRRRITSRYRHQCTLHGNSELLMSEPIEKTVEKIMATQEKPSDYAEAPAGSSHDVCMPFYSSCVFSDAVQLGILYLPYAISQWCSGMPANKEEVGATCVELGTAPGFTFAKSVVRGTCGWDSAWLSREETNGWRGFSRNLMGRNHTVRMFDLSSNGLRDLCYLLSTRDAARRITSAPYVPPSMQKTFVNNNDEAVAHGSYYIRMRGIKDTRYNDVEYEPGTEAAPRHPYSKVPNAPLQRSLDFALNHGRFPAMLPVVSNKVTIEPPVRIVYEGSNSKEVQLNVAAALEHTRMVAEASLRCSVHPGMENKQERFCDNVQGPPGLTAPVNQNAPPARDACTKLPYSYDLVTIALTLDGMSRMYDPIGREYCNHFMELYGASLGLNVTYEKLPHMSMRFVGFPEENRLLLSHKIPEIRNPVFNAVEVGDEQTATNVCDTTRALVSLSLSHDASDADIERHMKARAGSRAMSGVTGDLHSIQTWITHSCTALTERGMVSGIEDVVLAMVHDEPYGLRQRVVELASLAINRIVDKDPRMTVAGLQQPGDSECTPERLVSLKKERMRKVRNMLYQQIELPVQLEELRDCGPLRIKPDRHKLTYHNCEAHTQKEKEKETHNKRKTAAVSSAAQFQAGAFKRMAPPGKKRALLPETVRGRGLQDSRGRT